MTPLRVFVGYDQREAIGSAVFMHSLLRRASSPVSVTHLASFALRQGTNEFTCSRFLVPWLCGFDGLAIFVDGADMVMQADICEIVKQRQDGAAVQVVQHDYRTRHPRKYVGSAMESENRDYTRKNWASVMLFDSGHPAWRRMTYAGVRDANMMDLLKLLFLRDEDIGTLDKEWNVLVDEGQDPTNARILHWTAGIPAFPHYSNAPCDYVWHAEYDSMIARPE
jgi:hypothetical protein